MKIHIVQKGDTLWELAKEYGVDFNELKEANAHLSSPDMIMPGMKIKIPSTSKQVKKKTTQVKGLKNQVKEQPKPFSPKPLAVKEDDHLKQKQVKQVMPKKELKEVPLMPEMPQIPQMPPMMQMPMMEQPIQPPTPKKAVPKPVKEKVVEKQVKKQVEKKVEKPIKKKVEIKQEVPQMTMPMPQMPVCYQPMPMCCHVVPSCCCHHHGHHPMMHHMPLNNCCGMDHMFMGPEMNNFYEQPATMPAQTAEYEGHKEGLYNYANMHIDTPNNFGNDQYSQSMHQQSQPYPPFYRSTPESPPNPIPPFYPSMPVDGIDEEE